MRHESVTGRIVNLESRTVPPTLEGMRYRSLDAWRGIAGLCVVFYHVALVLVGINPVLRRNGWYHGCLHGYLGVEIFFVISGYCIMVAAASLLKRQGRWWDFLKARCRRIYPACWFSLALWVLFWLAATALVHSGHIKASTAADLDLQHRSLLYFFANITLTQFVFHQPFLSVVTWTLAYEVAFYAVVTANIVLLGRSGSLRTFLNRLHGLTILSLLVLVAHPGWIFFPFGLWAHFGLGVLVYDLLRHPGQRGLQLVFGGVLVAMLVLARLDHIPEAMLYNGGGATFLVSAVTALLLLGLAQHDEALMRQKPVRWLVTVGAFSYSLYLTNFLFIGLAAQVIRLLHLHGKALHVMDLLVAAGAVVFAWSFYLCFERPFLKPSGRATPAPQTAAPDAS